MQDQHLILRQWQFEDAPELARLLNNKMIWDNVRDYLPFPYTHTHAKMFIEMVSDINYGDKSYAIESNGCLAGSISISFKNDVYKLNGELGFWIGEPFWGKGIATDAVKIIINEGFSEHQLHRVFASIFCYNLASARVLEKADFRKEAVLKDAVIKNNQIIDEHIYALTFNEYNNFYNVIVRR